MPKNLKISNSAFLKVAIFATGLSGIVAEYVLATLATYFLGNQLVQWTLIISVMLFAMGLGSRLSRNIKGNLLTKFIAIEMALSLLVGFSAILVYAVAAASVYEGILIYGLCIAIGLLIGLEIPLVTRINNEYEHLRVNISSILEKDYYGSLLGGFFFAFIGLRYLTLSYTPVVLGSINFIVAVGLFLQLRKTLSTKGQRQLLLSQFMTLALLVLAFLGSEKAILYGDQKRYKDPVIFSKQTQYQKITITQWKDDYWLYINHNQQLSTLDEFLYHEPLVHPLMALSRPQEVLIIGGGDGCALNEVLKYDYVSKVTLVDLDPEMTHLAKNNSIFTEMNDSSLWSEKVVVIHADGKKYLEESPDFFDAIIVDLPDPKTIELSMLYSKEFYTLCRLKTRPNGAVITQAGSPYFATKAFYSIEKTMRAAGFNTLPMQNQVVTLGQWGWIIAHKSKNKEQMMSEIRSRSSESLKIITTRWLNNEALNHLFSFGKPLIDTTGIQVNTLSQPTLQQYYNSGNWDLY